MISLEQLSKLYKEGVTAHELRLAFVDDSTHHISNVDGKIENPYLELRRSELESAYRSTPSDYEDGLLQIGCARDVLDEAERYAKEALTRGQYVGLGYSSPSDSSPSIVPQSHWHFMTAIDFDEGVATGHELQYVGLRFLDTATLGEQALEAVKNALAQPAAQSSTASVTATTPATGNLQVFRDMSDLDWPEVSITLVAGDLVEVSARGKVRRVTYGECGLIDRRTGKGKLIAAGRIFLDMATRKISHNAQYKKNLSRLRKELQQAFGINGNPFYPPSTSSRHRHFPKFELEDARNKADQRVKERATHVSYREEIGHSVGGVLADDLEGRTEEYSYDEAGDAVDEWIRENEKYNNQ